MSLPIIEINREDDIDIKNSLKIDGKKIGGIRNVKIEYGVDNRRPIVTIELYPSKIKAKIRTTKMNVKIKTKRTVGAKK